MEEGKGVANTEVNVPMRQYTGLGLLQREDKINLKKGGKQHLSWAQGGRNNTRGSPQTSRRNGQLSDSTKKVYLIPGKKIG